MHNSKFFHLILLNHVYEDRRQNSERANEMKFCERYKSCLKQYLLIKNVLCFCLFVKAWTPIGLFYKMLHCLKAFICRLDEFLSVFCPLVWHLRECYILQLLIELEKLITSVIFLSWMPRVINQTNVA